MVGSGCAGPPAGSAGQGAPGDTAAVQRPILYGTPDLRPEHKAVVALVWGNGDSNFCSGTLIAPRVVLTAAHCLQKISPGVIYVYFGNDVHQGGQYVQAASIMPHPLYDADRFTYDVGLVRLESDAPSDATPIPILPAGQALGPADEGGPVQFVGFGLTEDNTTGVKLEFDGEIVTVCDGPDVCAYGGGGQVVPGAIGYSVQDGGPCSGDSGGPAFVTRGGRQYVAAVTSYGDEGCNFYGVSTRTDYYRDFIQAYVDGQTEQCDTPGDEDRDGLADCADPDCDGDAACPPDACLVPTTLGCGDEVSDTTVGGSYRLRSYTCAGVDLEPRRGPERAYALDVPKGIDVTVSMTLDGTGYLDLFLLPLFGSTCAVWDCLAGSDRAGSLSERLTFTMDDDLRLVVDTMDYPSAYTLQVDCQTGPERCDNHVDDDADGLTDCDDPDCATDGACQPPPENCVNGVDDDGDGLADCDDPDCADSRVCEPGPGNKGCQQGGGTPADVGLWLLGVALFMERRRRRRRGADPA